MFIMMKIATMNIKTQIPTVIAQVVVDLNKFNQVYSKVTDKCL
jgi:hypothetical protein